MRLVITLESQDSIVGVSKSVRSRVWDSMHIYQKGLSCSPFSLNFPSLEHCSTAFTSDISMPINDILFSSFSKFSMDFAF